MGIIELLLGVLAALVGSLFLMKRKADKASVDAKLAETKGRDAGLEASQDDVKEQINALDKGIEQMKAEREAQRIKDKNMTLAERRDRIRRGLQ